MNYIFILVTGFLTLVQSEDNIKCGKPYGNHYRLKLNRIVAGYDVGYYRYPWYASIQVGNKSVCGGALIATRTILTTASCYKNYLGNTGSSSPKLENVFNVTLGMYNSCVAENHRQTFRVEKVNIHELYLIKKPYYDIALLTLIGKTDRYKPICLPSATAPKPLEGTVIGMGALQFNGSLPCTLHEARMLLFSNNTCVKVITESGNNASSMENTFCAGYTQSNTSTCQGDLGSPFQVMTPNGDFVLLGLSSFGYHCAQPNVPDIYTDVSKYLKWINNKSGLNFNTALNLNPNHNQIQPISATYGKPFRKIIKIIINRGGKIIIIKKSVLHYPILH